MKKVLIARDIHELLEQNKTFLDRTDFRVFIAATNDEALDIHRTERVDLIITQLDMPGMTSEQFCSLIRDDADLRATSIIMVCPNTPQAIERAGRCGTNALLLQPIHPVVLMVKAQQLLDIAGRETLRVLLSANVDSHSDVESFFCRTVNVSATGMLIETNKFLAEGTRLSCSFYLPNAKKIQVSGKIIRSTEQAPGGEEFQYGLMFTDISAEAKQLLVDFIVKTSLKSRPIPS
jgi:DNA-binding response OmpR family regulator